MLHKILLKLLKDKYVINDLSSLHYKVYNDDTLLILHISNASVCPLSLVCPDPFFLSLIKIVAM